jgi:hypothetical protein
MIRRLNYPNQSPGQAIMKNFQKVNESIKISLYYKFFRDRLILNPDTNHIDPFGIV